MGDLPKAPDDATWSDVERTFFDAAPPEEPQPVGQAPRLDDLPAPRAEPPWSPIMGWLRPSAAGARRAAALVVQGAWQGTKLAGRAAGGLIQRVGRGTALVVVAGGVRVRDTARAGAAGLVTAVLSIWCVDRRRLAYAMVGVLVGAGLSTGVVASRRAAPTNGATAEREAPATGPIVAEAAPVANSPSSADPAANVGPPADVGASRADVTNRRRPAYRRSVPASSSTRRPMVTAFMDRQTYWAHEGRSEGRSAPARSSRSFFSR